ncbi:MAG: hypothetical protein PHP42_04745 [Bacteroidota bacterium]|nr:hypothetical protein [Bacteroidota bacterium]
MNWLNEIDTELHRVQPNENSGRTRTIARRIAGIALIELQKNNPDKHFEKDYLKVLREILASTAHPNDVLAAAHRLQARVNVDFTSPSTDPIADAMIIVEYVKQQLHS